MPGSKHLFRSLPLTLLLAALGSAGCGRSHGSGVSDASVTDAGPAADAAESRPDAWREPTPSALADALSCHLSTDEALAAAVRLVSCDPERRLDVTYVMENWEVGLSAGVDPNGGGPPVSCEELRCGLRSSSCEQLAACEGLLRVAADCGDRSLGCVGDVVVACRPDGDEPVLDCGEFGAVCEDGACHRGECTFGMEYYRPACEGDELVLCDDLRVDCGVSLPGTSCSSVAVGGEAPSYWCAPAGAERYGLYGGPVTCTPGGAIVVESFSGRTFHYDCGSQGYAGCDERGCVP